jgi:hypothetical protein
VRDEVACSWIHGQGLKAAAFERAIGNLDHLARQPC